MILYTIIKKYKQFELLVVNCAREKYKPNDVKTLKEILGKHIRRISTDFSVFEKTLQDNIQQNLIDWLIIKDNIGDETRYEITEKIDVAIDDLPF